MTIPRAEACFSAHYAAARRRFVQAAQRAGAQMHAVTHPRKGLHGEVLSMDCAWLGPRLARRVLVSLSGTHGIEGYAGSACQLAWLQGGEHRLLPENTAVWMVHAVNPWGFSWHRRVDDARIDVNRNAWSDAHALAQNPDYAAFHDRLAASDPAHADGQALVDAMGPWMRQWDARRLSRAISGGQYTHPDGLFYGGQAPSWSVRTLATLAARELADAHTVAVLDHHTGLGPQGHTEIICRHGADSSALQMARRWWGADVTATELGESSSDALDGNVRMAFVRWCPQAEVISAALEVGTLAPEAVLRALLEDHQAHRRPISARRQIRAREAMRAAFVPAQAHWQQACVQRALELYAATLRGLTSA